MQLVYANARRSITCTRAHVHRQSGVTDITARDLVLEINTHLLYNITEVQNLVATSALATLVHFAATRFLLFAYGLLQARPARSENVQIYVGIGT